MNLHLAKEWLKYYHLKTDEHSLHSPYFFKFYKEIIKSTTNELAVQQRMTELYRSFINSDEVIEMIDYGAGSKVTNSTKRKIREIAKSSTSSNKFSHFLLRLSKKHQFKSAIELGTSLGINTAYLAHNQELNIKTFEGDPQLCRLARNHLKSFKNVEVFEGNIDTTLPAYLTEEVNKVDLIYMDANHTFEATLRYFNLLLPYLGQHSIVVIDDIHWSREMSNAWIEIKKHSKVTSSIDIFDAGILFFNTDFKKQHYILSF